MHRGSSFAVGRENSRVLIPVSPGRLSQLTPLASWMVENLGLSMTLLLPVNENNEQNAVLGMAKEVMMQYPNLSFVLIGEGVNVSFCNTVPFDLYKQVVLSPYIVSDDIPGKEAILCWGAPREAVATLEIKDRFYEYVASIREVLDKVLVDHGIEGGAILPHTISRAEDLVANVEPWLKDIKEMYNAAKMVAFQRGKNKRAEKIAQYEPEVILRLVWSGGGYGTFRVALTMEGKYKFSEDSIEYIYDTLEEGIRFMQEEGKISAGSRYIITRYVNTKPPEEGGSPSVGTYFGNGGVASMKVTAQFIIDDECKGGCSWNAVSDEYRLSIANLARPMQCISDIITMVLAEQSGAQGHCNVDFIVAGVLENALREVVYSDDELKTRYGQSVIELAITECNPRLTSISLAVAPIYHFLAQRGLVEKNLTIETLRMIYGEEVVDSNGNRRSAAFATLDYLTISQGIGDETDLLKFIDEFNEKCLDKFGIFLIPKMSVDDDPHGGKKTAIIIGMVPTGDKQRLRRFQKLIRELDRRKDTHVLRAFMENDI